LAVNAAKMGDDPRMAIESHRQQQTIAMNSSGSALPERHGAYV
jgi:hypothetical protein